jgi:hypothetical protein
MKNEVRIVGTFEYQDGKFVSVDHNRRTFNSHKPVPIPVDQIQNYYPLKLSSVVNVGNPLNQLALKAGVSYPAASGHNRIIIEATKDKILFVSYSDAKSAPGFYIQSPNGFHQDWLDLVLLDAARHTAPAVTLAEWEVQFLVGVIAGVGWRGLAAVVGVDVFEEAITQKKTKATKDAIRMLQILLAFRKELQPVAPTLTSVVSDLMWLSLLKGQKQFLASEMANDPKVAARAAGTISAQLGKQALDQRLTATSFIWTILSQVGIKGALTIPAALSKTVSKLSSSDPKDIASNIEDALKSVGVVLSPAEIAEIIRELEANPVKIAQIFSKMVLELHSRGQ